MVTSAGANLTYDPLGRLYETYKASTGTTQVLYDGDQLTAEYDGAGNLLRRYVHGDGEDDPLVWYEGSGVSSPRYLYSDHQGSIVAVTDASGNVSRINAYDDYGIPNAGNDVSVAGRFQYTGQAWIPELGMYHYKARVYSPTLGRFLQTDPIGYDDQVNLYAYVDNDPIDGRDPDGLCGLPCKWGVDFLIEVGIQIATEGKVDLGAAAIETVKGAVNPLRTVERARDLYRAVKPAQRVAGVAARGTQTARATDRAALRNAGVPVSRARSDVKGKGGAPVPKDRRQQVARDSRGSPVVVSRHGPHPAGNKPHDRDRHSHANTPKVNEKGELERKSDGSVRYNN